MLLIQKLWKVFCFKKRKDKRWFTGKPVIFGRKVIKSAKLMYTNGWKVCSSNLLMVVYIHSKFGGYSKGLADIRKVGSSRPLPQPTKPQKNPTVVGLSDLLIWLVNDDIANDVIVVNDVNVNLNDVNDVTVNNVNDASNGCLYMCESVCVCVFISFPCKGFSWLNKATDILFFFFIIL